MSLVLVADDEEALLEVLCEAVTGMGHECVRADDGEAALALARARRPDLVISDQMMPRRSGVELALALRDDPALATVPVIIMSAVRPKELDGAWRFLAKPLALVDFERAISLALGHAPTRPALRPQLALAHALDETLHWVAHELKSPLSSAQLTAQLLHRRLAPDADPRLREGLEVIQRQLGRMSRFIGAALDAVQLSEGRLSLQRQQVELCAWLDERAAGWRALHPQARVEVAPPAAPLPLDVDPARLAQALDALVANAVAHGSAALVEVAAEVTPSRVDLRVRDHGPGIAAEALPGLLERLSRRPAPGQGQGLFIAASLLRLHGGELSVTSAPGEGATFTASLPRGG